jgi:hypothetical protein
VKINDQEFDVAFVAGGWWYLRRVSDDQLFRTSAVELKPKMHLEMVNR